MLLLAKSIFIGDKSLKASVAFFASAMMDKLLFIMGGMYFFYWIGSLFSEGFENNYGDFFDHIGLLLVVYVATVVSSWLSKIYNDAIFAPIGFAFLTYLLAFPTVGSFLSLIFAVGVAIFSIMNKLDTKILTWSLVGYWLLLFVVSAGDYTLFDALSEGVIATFIEVWTITWNAAGYTVYNQGVSGIGGILVILFGIFITRLLNGQLKLPSYEKKEKGNLSKEEMVEMAKSKEEVKLKNNRVFNETVDQRVQQLLQNKVITPYPMPIQVEDTEIASTEEQQIKETKSKENKKELSSKRFFNIQTPTLKIKLTKALEEGLRRLAK